MNKQETKTKLKEYLKDTDFKDNVKKLAIFGSFVNSAPRKDSDIDLLVEFEKPIGFFELIRIQEEIGDFLGRKVDLVTPSALSKYFRKDVLRYAETVYEK